MAFLRLVHIYIKWQIKTNSAPVGLVLFLINNIMKNENIVNEINKSKVKIFFKLNQLPEITGLKIRALKYRMVEIKNKYANIPSLLKKEGRYWQIHYTIIDEFLPKKTRKQTNIYTFDWQNLVTWNPLKNYDVAYHVELVHQIKKQLPNNTILYAVETDLRNINHIHFITDAQKDELETVVNNTLQLYLTHKIGNKLNKEYYLEINKIFNKYNLVSYLRKAPLANGII